ncbi:putative gpi anchored cell wall protein [Botrytis fragariae]|uniref:Putative gpi anchored cell wall protein n=1 Tax=Botrytis fragariae TaxID=1964551 RepID=A0A8H6AM82_9HELO|nr:putative gpi anchored cell wall protein [Botrytis fragariae]KAF5869860.1 putative gpi anchored cell wall protein [Botrytis fragariae]
MQTPTLLTISLLFLSNALSVTATPPACLLAAINVQSDPSDLKALCGTLEDAVAGNITDKCSGDNYKEAVSSYQATCFEGAGVNITITSSSASATGTNTASISGSGSASATATGSGAKATGTASATGSSGSSASATGSTTGASAATATGGVGALVVPGLLGVVGLVGAVLF